MRVLIGDDWRAGYLDYYRPSDCCRIRVSKYLNITRLRTLYFIHPRSLRLLWNYLREIGPLYVARKVLSRSREAARNRKYLSVGTGFVLESPEGAGFLPGQPIMFIAPAHPECVERLVLRPELVRPIDEPTSVPVEPSAILHAKSDHSPGQLASLGGWSEWSGAELPTDLEAVFREVHSALAAVEWESANRLETEPAEEFRTSRESGYSSVRKSRKTAVLFGYGNYAKTVIIPNVAGSLVVRRVHEIDPLQLPETGSSRWATDTSSEPGDQDQADAWLIAGYHHSHGPLAAAALQRRICAVVEKPLVVDRNQLQDLLAAMSGHDTGYFACFHKRYLPFNDYARIDLGVGRDDPVHYHCIVYEVPLPELHWYRWPNSKSRLVSNGCHWIDHFLYLNHYSAPARLHAETATNGTLDCFLELKNGAVFSMLLTDIGSGRVGVQDHVEMRHKDVTVRMINGSEYRAENSRKIIRRGRINKMLSYKLMYSRIGKTILAGGSGDSMESIRVSAETVLDLEECHASGR